MEHIKIYNGSKDDQGSVEDPFFKGIHISKFT